MQRGVATLIERYRQIQHARREARARIAEHIAAVKGM